MVLSQLILDWLQKILQNNEVVITFRTTVPDSINEVENQGIAYWDHDGDGIVEDNETVVTDDPITNPNDDPTIVTNPRVCPPAPCSVPCGTTCGSTCDTGIATTTAPIISGADGVTIPLLSAGESLVGFSQGSNGSVYLDDGGTPDNPLDDILRYVPNEGFSGSDEFSYTIIDSNGNAVTKTQKVDVSNNAVGREGVVINPLSDGGSLISFTQPEHGTVTLDDGGTPDNLTDDLLRYVPDSGYIGPDAFTYTIIDNNGDMVTKTFTVNVDARRSDNGDALGTFSIILMMLLTGLIGLYYIRREEQLSLEKKEK